MSTVVPFEHAFAMERAIRTYLAVQGVATIPCNEFSGRNDTHQRAPMAWRWGPDRKLRGLVLPDLVKLPDFEALEIKTQGYAPLFKRAGVRTTGFLRRHYQAYRTYETLTGKPVGIAFVHLVEDEIRGGFLSDIEPFKSDRINVSDFPEILYWEYDSLPVWPVSLSSLLDVAKRYGPQLKGEGYTPADHAAVITYRDTVAIPNAAKHRGEWGSRKDPAA